MIDTAISGGGGFAMVVEPRYAPLAKPLCLQRLERALRLDGLVAQLERTLNDKSLDKEINTTVSKQQSKAVKTRIYNLSKVKKNKKWLKNILLDKTDDDSSDNLDIESDLKDDDCIREMLRFHRLDKKVRKECSLQTDPQQQLMQYQHYSTSLLNPIQEQFIVSINTNKTPNSRSKSTKVSVSKSKKSKTTTPVVGVISSVTTNGAIEVKTEDTNTCLSTITDPLTLLDKPIKVKKIGLDDITYDTHLPKEILETKCSNTSPFVELSVTSSYTQSSNVTNLLPEDIFDTEESFGSVLSQTLSQQTPTHPTMTNFSIPKYATVPTTPTCLSPLTSPILPSKRSTKKKTSTTTSLMSDESTMNARRKSLWITIARKEIPKVYKQKQMLRKEALMNCQTIANWCQREQLKRTLIHQKQLGRHQYPRARRLTKEMLVYWKQFDKVKNEYRKRLRRRHRIYFTENNIKIKITL
ncbi:chromatin-remodeling ATPase INO80-like [Oppia nitens]|uniref:chromatin-remodeling ATPase INO80-like n=1 Tax=Oppia nitens TaxID=1686743 RepID=UPI0023DC328F|nr:chromatin-remodeling ATPase INO80-like [Oppia nitens]